MYHDNWWGGGMMWFLWIPLLVLLIVIVVKLLDQNKRDDRQETPLEILKRRYAKGEISKEEYEERKRTLE